MIKPGWAIAVSLATSLAWADQPLDRPACAKEYTGYRKAIQSRSKNHRWLIESDQACAANYAAPFILQNARITEFKNGKIVLSWSAPEAIYSERLQEFVMIQPDRVQVARLQFDL